MFIDSIYDASVTQNTYSDSLKAARTSFAQKIKRKSQITQELNEINDELVKLRRTITALAAMCSESPAVDNLGITDMCMEVMENTPFSLSTQEVVDRLQNIGYDINSQKNVNASVHAVLTRLGKNGKIAKVGDGDKVMWRGPNYDKQVDQGIAEITDEDIPF